jgi:hypothetical protein
VIVPSSGKPLVAGFASPPLRPRSGSPKTVIRFQFGLTSAPIIPQRVQTAFGHKSLSAVSSGHGSASTTAL